MKSGNGGEANFPNFLPSGGQWVTRDNMGNITKLGDKARCAFYLFLLFRHRHSQLVRELPGGGAELGAGVLQRLPTREATRVMSEATSNGRSSASSDTSAVGTVARTIVVPDDGDDEGTTAVSVQGSRHAKTPGSKRTRAEQLRNISEHHWQEQVRRDAQAVQERRAEADSQRLEVEHKRARIYEQEVQIKQNTAAMTALTSRVTQAAATRRTLKDARKMVHAVAKELEASENKLMDEVDKAGLCLDMTAEDVCEATQHMFAQVARDGTQIPGAMKMRITFSAKRVQDVRGRLASDEAVLKRQEQAEMLRID